MNRREFLLSLNPLRGRLSDAKAKEKTSSSSRADQNKLFVQAMARGIDPATIDPKHLETLLRPEGENN